MDLQRLLLLFSLLLFYIPWAKGQDVAAYEAALHISKGDTLPYRILYPRNFDPLKKYPLLLFLHGAGERGNDNLAQLMYGSRLLAQENSKAKYPAIVIFPQCPANSFWANVEATRDTMPYEFNFQEEGAPTTAMQLLLELLDEQKNKPYINQQRLYVGGLSMGGMGALELLRRRPHTFAAAVAICGGDNPPNAAKYAHETNIWLFHGKEDPVVPAHHSIRLAERLRSLGARPKLSIYPGVDHTSWEQALAEPDLLPWLFSQQKDEKTNP